MISLFYDNCCVSGHLQVYGMVQNQALQEKRALTLFSHNVCQKSFRMLLGIGKKRMQRLRAAAINKEPECPIDQRFLPRAYSTFPRNEVRPAIVEFLQSLYHTTAEPLPEAASQQPQLAKEGPSNMVRRRGKRPRHFHKYDAESCRKEKGHVKEAKFLPPGTILEYLEHCRTANPSLKIGRKVFTRVSVLDCV